MAPYGVCITLLSFIFVDFGTLSRKNIELPPTSLLRLVNNMASASTDSSKKSDKESNYDGQEYFKTNFLVQIRYLLLFLFFSVFNKMISLC